MPTVYKCCLDYKVKHSNVFYPIALDFIVNTSHKFKTSFNYDADSMLTSH